MNEYGAYRAAFEDRDGSDLTLIEREALAAVERATTLASRRAPTGATSPARGSR